MSTKNFQGVEFDTSKKTVDTLDNVLRSLETPYNYNNKQLFSATTKQAGAGNESSKPIQTQNDMPTEKNPIGQQNWPRPQKFCPPVENNLPRQNNDKFLLKKDFKSFYGSPVKGQVLSQKPSNLGPPQGQKNFYMGKNLKSFCGSPKALTQKNDGDHSFRAQSLNQNQNSFAEAMPQGQREDNSSFYNGSIFGSYPAEFSKENCLDMGKDESRVMNKFNDSFTRENPQDRYKTRNFSSFRQSPVKMNHPNERPLGVPKMARDNFFRETDLKNFDRRQEGGPARAQPKSFQSYRQSPQKRE